METLPQFASLALYRPSRDAYCMQGIIKPSKNNAHIISFAEMKRQSFSPYIKGQGILIFNDRPTR